MLCPANYVERTRVCRILGARVSELEKKLKTLEMTGFWNITGTLIYLFIYLFIY